MAALSAALAADRWFGQQSPVVNCPMKCAVYEWTLIKSVSQERHLVSLVTAVNSVMTCF